MIFLSRCSVFGRLFRSRDLSLFETELREMLAREILVK